MRCQRLTWRLPELVVEESGPHNAPAPPRFLVSCLKGAACVCVLPVARRAGTTAVDVRRSPPPFACMRARGIASAAARLTRILAARRQLRRSLRARFQRRMCVRRPGRVPRAGAANVPRVRARGANQGRAVCCALAGRWLTVLSPLSPFPQPVLSVFADVVLGSSSAPCGALCAVFELLFDPTRHRAVYRFYYFDHLPPWRHCLVAANVAALEDVPVRGMQQRVP